MQYVDQQKLPEIIAAYYAGQDRRGRLVGIDRAHDSSYYDILRFYGRNAVDPLRIAISYTTAQFRLTDPLIRAYAQEIESHLRSAGRLHSGPTVTRLQQFDAGTPYAGASFQEALYGEQAGTSFALDYPHPLFEPWGGTLRHYYKTVYPSLSLEHNPLGICLGVCSMLLVEEQREKYMLLVRRHGRLATLEDSVGPSVAGALDWSTNYPSLGAALVQMLGAELQEELYIPQTSATIVPLAYAREILRGDRPQLFGLAITHVRRDEISDAIKAHSSRNEYDEFEFVRLDQGRLDKGILGRLNFEARMSYFLAEEYLATALQ